MGGAEREGEVKTEGDTVSRREGERYGTDR